MTNREKAIADFTEFLKALNTDQLTYVINYICCVNFCCQHCIYGDNDGNCKVEIEKCYSGIKEWLEQENNND